MILMKFNLKANVLLKVFLILLPVTYPFTGCVEPVELQTEDFKSALVVEGIITDELKRQEIQLRRTFPLEVDGPSPESDALVSVTDDFGNEYLFEEAAPGYYLSLDEFQAISGRSYVLHIETAGGTYVSQPQQIPTHSEISDLYAERTLHKGDDGVALLVDLEASSGASGYFKYTYEETYKIISPFTFPLDLVYRDGKFIEVPKTKEERVCYATKKSQEIILANTNAQEGNRLNHYLVRFIDSDNAALAYRYSLLLKQYSISEETYSFYETLKDFSDSESIFSQNQPGFINGNIRSVQNPDEKVIGVFSAAAVDSERIFFNFEDFFDLDEGRPLGVECEISRPSVLVPPLAERLGAQLNQGRVKYLGSTIVAGPQGSGPFRVVQAECVDCTLRGTSKVPEFWVE